MRIAIIFLLVAALQRCNSLLSELDRIRNANDYKNSEAPTVVLTDPADGATGPYSQNYIDITFSTTIDAGSASVQASDGSCSGSLQFSTDSFATCIGGSLDTSSNPRLRFSPSAMPRGVVIRLRVLAWLTNSYGKPALEYTSPQGMSFETLCGTSNCFFSTSLPLMTSTGSYSAMFLIRSGTHAGKLVVMTQGQTTTTMVDFTALNTTVGPTLPAAPGAGLHTFPVTQGVDAGKEMVLAGGTQTFLYDPVSHNFAVGPAPTGAVGAGAFSFSPVAGAQAGKTLTVLAGGTKGVNIYPDNLGNFANFAMFPGPNLPGVGGHTLRLAAGSAASYFFLAFGNGTSESLFFDEAAGNFIAGPTLAGNAGTGAASFVVGTGPLAGRILTLLGGNSNATNLYDVGTSTNEGNGPALTQTLASGGLLLYRYGTQLADAPLVLHGGLLGSASTSRFDATSATFVPGPLTHGAISLGSAALFVPSGTGPGFFFLVNGLTTANTQVYSIADGGFVGNTLPGSTPNAGAHAFVISSGLHSGRTMVIAGGGARHTAIYDPASHGFYQGPFTVSNISSSGISIPLTRGAYAGRVVVFAGGGVNTYDVYNPPDNSFKAMVDLGYLVTGTPLAITAGASAFEMADGKILIMNGGGTTTQILDQENYAFINLGTPTAGCSVNLPYNLRYTRPSDSRAMQLVWCSGSLFTVFDHVLKTFSLHSALGGGTGLQAFVIPSGAQQGNIALVHGGSSTAWSILSAEDLSTIGGLRSLAGCTTTGVAAGSQIIPITAGVNAGKHLLVVGNASRETCIFDPTTLAFTPGPPVGNVDSPAYKIISGSLVFPTRGGQYPTAYVLLSGQNKNVWSTFVP